jgi:hypothetical protein
MDRRAFLTSLLVTPAVLGAPRLKPRAYEPKDWIDKLANDPPEVRPWAALEARMRDMDKATCLEVGRRLSGYLHERYARLGWADFASEFDLPDGRPTWDLAVAVLFHCKWLEHYGWGTPTTDRHFHPPAWFWWGWENAPEWAKK